MIKVKNGSRGRRDSSVIDGEYESAVYIDRENSHHKLNFDMRHVESPENILANFCPDSYWFNTIFKKDLDSIVNYLYNNDNSTGSSLVRSWVSTNTYSNEPLLIWRFFGYQGYSLKVK